MLLCRCGADPTPGYQTCETCRSGYYNGRHFTEYVEEVKSLKRAGRLDEAARLLRNLVEATEGEGRATGTSVAPWYYEHLAIVYRKLEDPVNEKRLLVRFAEQVHAPGAAPEKLFRRLHAIGVTEAELSRIEARQAANLEAAEKVRRQAVEKLADETVEALLPDAATPSARKGRPWLAGLALVLWALMLAVWCA